MSMLGLFFIGWFILGLIGSIFYKNEPKKGIVWYLLGTVFGLIMFIAMLYDNKHKNVEVIKEKGVFKVEEFNDWFKTEYTGYDGHKGAAGIFLRTDKLSPSMINDYLLHIGFSNIEADQQSFLLWEEVRKNWISQR